MVRVSVKWQKETFSDLDIDMEQPPILFKGQLYALTGVAPDRQKIMVKGGLLQDDGDWAKYSIKEGQRLMMMGTAEALPEAPQKATVFVEDLPEEDQEGAAFKHSTAGLVNLGNTCYMNSTLQCLHAVPELRAALQQYSPTSGIEQDSTHKVTLATKELFGELDTSLRPVAPFQFLIRLREKFPQFAQTGNHGIYMQQDAEECWTQLVFALSQRLNNNVNSTTTPTTPPGPSPTPPLSKAAVMEALFGVELQSTTQCAESGETITATETVYTLKCHISSEVNQLHQGLARGFTDELEKVSPALGRSALHTKQSVIHGLPKYLTVQFVRFFWKRESQQKAKILRKVGFPLLLDVYDFCTPELKQRLDAPRKALRKRDDALAGLTSGPASSSTSAAPEMQSAAAAGIGADKVPQDAVMAESQAEAATDGKESDEQTGYFDLVSVLTHKGRSADSGHYVAWVKQDSGKWIEFDDENPIPRREEDIINLSGGGDWHMAYILVYKAHTVAMP